MSDFRTPLLITPSGWKIGLKSRILTVGSCFSDAIGGRLADHKFQTLVNPFGVIYNPLSIHKALDYCLSGQEPGAEAFGQHGDIHFHYDFHSTFSSLSLPDLKALLRKTLDSVSAVLPQTEFIMITYGTAWVYERTGSGEVVANCHKQPSALFRKRLISPEEITRSFSELVARLRKTSPGIRIILTVSPVRHVKETLELNSVSKATLRLACHQLVEENDAVEYFPAYELMMDDLRDYRFYKGDLIHPNEQAESLIWSAFLKRYADSEAINFTQKWAAILNGLHHKPFHPLSSGHKNFLLTLKSKLEDLRNIADVEAEYKVIQGQLDVFASKDVNNL